jgi:hypothetical protein
MSGHHLEIVPQSPHHCYIDSDLRAPTPADVKGPVVEP